MTAFNIVNAIIIIGLIISAVSIFILDDVLQFIITLNKVKRNKNKEEKNG